MAKKSGKESSKERKFFVEKNNQKQNNLPEQLPYPSSCHQRTEPFQVC